MNENFGKRNLNIDSRQSGLRLDRYLQKIYPDLSRSFIQNQIQKHHVLINGKPEKNGYKLKPHDVIHVDFVRKKIENAEPEDIALDIIHEDNDIVVINKPAGMVVHPAAGNFSGTLVNALLYHCQSLSTVNGVLRPGIVHRLDKNTSGLLVVAKNNYTHSYLQKQFVTRDIKRTYRAIVWGRPQLDKALIETKIARSKRDRKKMITTKTRGKIAQTSYSLLNDYNYLSELELILHTGRTHQIRVHLNYLGFPVFGDPEYKGRKSQIKRLPAYVQNQAADILKNINRQALHARKLSFIHPQTQKKVEFSSELPEDYQQTIKAIKKNFI